MSENEKMIHIRIPKKLWVYYKKQTIKEESTMTAIVIKALESYKEKAIDSHQI